MMEILEQFLRVTFSWGNLLDNLWLLSLKVKLEYLDIEEIKGIYEYLYVEFKWYIFISILNTICVAQFVYYTCCTHTDLI